MSGKKLIPLNEKISEKVNDTKLEKLILENIKNGEFTKIKTYYSSPKYSVYFHPTPTSTLYKHFQKELNLTDYQSNQMQITFESTRLFLNFGMTDINLDKLKNLRYDVLIGSGAGLFSGLVVRLYMENDFINKLNDLVENMETKPLYCTIRIYNNLFDTCLTQRTEKIESDHYDTSTDEMEFVISQYKEEGEFNFSQIFDLQRVELNITTSLFEETRLQKVIVKDVSTNLPNYPALTEHKGTAISIRIPKYEIILTYEDKNDKRFPKHYRWYRSNQNVLLDTLEYGDDD